MRIYTVEELWQLTRAKRAVISRRGCCIKPKPAAFVFNMNCSQVYQLLQDGLYVYEKPAKKPF